MILEKTVEEVEGMPSKELPMPAGAAFYASLLAGLIVVVGILWGPLADASDKGVDGFNAKVPVAVAPPMAAPPPAEVP
jgi:hypothetical protein